MPLRKRWHPMERATIGSVPDRYGVYEFGDGEGNVVAVDHGPLRDELKSALAYDDAEQVRWETTQTREQAERLVEEHRDRL